MMTGGTPNSENHHISFISWVSHGEWWYQWYYHSHDDYHQYFQYCQYYQYYHHIISSHYGNKWRTVHHRSDYVMGMNIIITWCNIDMENPPCLIWYLQHRAIFHGYVGFQEGFFTTSQQSVPWIIILEKWPCHKLK